jgi:hypothetical protein
MLYAETDKMHLVYMSLEIMVVIIPMPDEYHHPVLLGTNDHGYLRENVKSVTLDAIAINVAS